MVAQNQAILLLHLFSLSISELTSVKIHQDHYFPPGLGILPGGGRVLSLPHEYSTEMQTNQQ